MTLKKITEMLKATGFPVAYRSFKTKQKLPYICILIPGSNNFIADGKVYHRKNRLHIELYTEDKNEAAETAVENVLDAAEMVWEKSEVYIQSEQMLQTIYETEV